MELLLKPFTIFLFLYPVLVNATPWCQIHKTDAVPFDTKRIRTTRSIGRRVAQLFHGGRPVSADEMKNSMIMGAASNLMLKGVHMPYNSGHIQNERLRMAMLANGRNQAGRQKTRVPLVGGKMRYFKNRNKMMGKLKTYFKALLPKKPMREPEDEGRNYYDSHENSMTVDDKFGGGRRAYWI